MFSPKALVKAENGKQDKVEYSARFLRVLAAHRDDILWVLTRLGAPPPVYKRSKDGGKERRTRIREEHQGGYGWIFNGVATNHWSNRRMVEIRKSPLLIERGAGKRPKPIQPPLFAGECDWFIKKQGEELSLSGTLNLFANPTRFVRHHPLAADLPEGMQARNLDEPPDGERAFDNQDNWFPLSPELYAQLTPEQWGRHLARYFGGIEEAVESEFERVCFPKLLARPRVRRFYNVQKVETLWEWLSPDPLKLIADLEPHARTFSSRRRGERIYKTEVDNESSGDVRILRIETAPGEWLKIYAKTNRRIRMEVVHTLAGRNGFKFPRERDAEGTVRRPSSHTCNSLQGMLGIFDRLRTRAATVVNDFLRHVADQSEIVPSHVSAYHALLDIAHAIPNDLPMALEFASLLIHGGCIEPGGAEKKRQTLKALRAKGIIEPTRNGNNYVPTADYRHAFKMLREHASFSILIERATRKVRLKRRAPDHHTLLD